jgi:hypothetical protein
MSYMDDIFDIEDALKNDKPALRTFQEFVMRFSDIQNERDILREEKSILVRAIKIVNDA